VIYKIISGYGVRNLEAYGTNLQNGILEDTTIALVEHFHYSGSYTCHEFISRSYGD